MRGRLRSRSDEQFREACARGFDVSDVLRALGLRPAGGIFRTAKINVARLGVDTSHFSTAAQLRGLPARNAAKDLSANDLFCERSRAYGSVVTERAHSTILPIVCASCGNAGEWHGGPLTLQLDHVNGRYDDDRLGNLRWLCPNC